MSNYTELVKALRSASTVSTAWEKLMRDAAAAIEDLEGFLAEAERDRDEYEERMRKEQERVIELQAEVKRLAECNNELREAQTYIDHYGDKWLTSAKDVPTSAYNHGYMDGWNEARAKMEVQE